MKISISLCRLGATALAAILVLTLGACATSTRHRAIAAVTVAPDGRVAVQEFLQYPPAGYAAELEEAIASQQLRALPGREWAGVWSTHAFAEYSVNGRGFHLRTLHLDPLLLDVVPPSFSASASNGVFSMRYEILRPVAPYHVTLVPPPNFALSANIVTSHETIPLRFSVDADGVPRDVRVARSHKTREKLEDIVLDVFRQWRFAADRIDGRPVASEDLLAYVTVLASASQVVYIQDDMKPRLRAPITAGLD